LGTSFFFILCLAKENKDQKSEWMGRNPEVKKYCLKFVSGPCHCISLIKKRNKADSFVWKGTLSPAELGENGTALC
jgi:hypothetical protein